MSHFNYNGKLLPEGTPVIGADNRGLRYGDGLFETIKCINQKLILLDEHLARLWNGMLQMKFQIPKLLTPDILQEQISHLVKKNNLTNARIRLSVIRGDGGLYDAKNHIPIYIIQTWPIEGNTMLNQNGLRLAIFNDALKTADKFSSLKHNNFLPYVMGAIFAKEQQCNDAIILNNVGRVADTTIANIFLVKNEKVITPSLEEGCVAGVMRKFILRKLLDNGYDVKETSITMELLLEADEVFLSNSMYNMKWVACIGDTSYKCEFTSKIYHLLMQTHSDVFC